MPSSDVIWGFLGVLVGGLGGRFVDGIFARSSISAKGKLDAEAEFRKTMHDELGVLRTKVDKLSSELDTWKNRYYKLLGEMNRLQARLGMPITEIEADDTAQDASP